MDDISLVPDWGIGIIRTSLENSGPTLNMNDKSSLHLNSIIVSDRNSTLKWGENGEHDKFFIETLCAWDVEHKYQLDFGKWLPENPRE